MALLCAGVALGQAPAPTTAGRELYFVVNHNLQDLDGDNRFHSLTSDVIAKASYTFRF
jgi:hypothetical protein